MDLYENISAIEQRLFKYEIAEVPALLDSMIENISSLIEGWPVDGVSELQAVLNLIVSAMENRDYQLMADVLHFELKPLLKRSLA